MKERNPNDPALGIEFWVGLFVILGLLAFSYISINVARMKFSDRGYKKITAVFTDVSGLKLGAPVEVAGVQVGSVSNVNLEDTRALVTLQILEAFPVRDDDIAQIRTKGIIGDKYVRLSPGGSDQMVEHGGKILDTESSVDFEDVIGKFIHSLDKDDSKDEKTEKKHIVFNA